MILKKIKIMNYRQLQSVELDMQESLTVLAGPNNSGKTTLISVLKGMFCDKKLGFSYSDIPISLSSMWLEKTVPVFQEIMHEYDKEKGVQKIIDEMTDNDKLSKDYTIDNFRAQIQVDYDPDSDNIQYFADYLMDLDDTKHSFYFIYTYEPSITAFEKGLNERYNRMAARVRDIKNPGCIEKETKFYFLKEELLRIYCNAVIEKCYFCNSNYKNENSMEVAAFKSLFNFQNIPAMRELDDNESDSSKGISKRVIALLKDNDTWVEATKKLPDLLMADIEDSGAKKEIKNSSIKSLDDTIRDISKTSGGHIGKLQLEMDVKEQDVEEFIRRITRAKYDVDGLLLNEESQGLGFSNLIYLHMRLEEFYKSIDKNKVNVFFICSQLSTDTYNAYNHIATNHKQFVKDTIALVPEGGNYKDLPEGVGNSRNFHMAWTRLDGNAPARTVDTGHRNLFHYELNRVPTVRESARIQSFPDNFVFKGSRTKQERQVGNAVPPLLGQALAEELLKIIERSKTNA